MQRNRRKNRLGNNRYLLKKIRDSKGIFHAKTGTIKDRNAMGLPEGEDNKKRWQEYTEELYKKDLHNPDNHDLHNPDNHDVISRCDNHDVISRCDFTM